MLAQGSCMVDAPFNVALYGESVGRYKEIDDYLNMTYEDMLRPKDIRGNE